MSEKRSDDGKTVGDEDQTITAPTPPQGQVSVPVDDEGEDEGRSSPRDRSKSPPDSGRRFKQ